MKKRMRLIDADTLKKQIHEYICNDNEEWTRDQEFSMMYVVDDAPTIESIQHCKWIIEEVPDSYSIHYDPFYGTTRERHQSLVSKIYCSNCGYSTFTNKTKTKQIIQTPKFNYCPNCGYKIDNGDQI